MPSDNAAVLTGIPRGGGRVALELELIALSVGFRHSRPYHPQTCGKVERFHQTLKRWLARQHRAERLRASWACSTPSGSSKIDSWPQRAFGRRSPADAFAARPKAVPLGTPIQDGHFRVRRDCVRPANPSPCATTASSTISLSTGATPASPPCARPRSRDPSPVREGRPPARPDPRPKPRPPATAETVKERCETPVHDARDTTLERAPGIESETLTLSLMKAPLATGGAAKCWSEHCASRLRTPNRWSRPHWSSKRSSKRVAGSRTRPDVAS